VENRPVPLPARNPGPYTGRGNNTWLLDGAEPALIDAGVGVQEHVDAIAGALGGRPLARVLVTHGHTDHASGVPALRARWPNLSAHKWTAGDEPGWLPLGDGQTIRAGNIDLVVVHTPGHAADHVCFWNPLTADLFAGDMVVRGTTVMIPGGRGGSLREYLDSLRRLAALRPERIYPGHGPIIDRPLDLIAEYLEQRQMREAQVIACLRDGVTDPEAMLPRIYPDLAPTLRPAALATIEAHLEKLREDERRKR
jgi:glyoxylase-like metal-dependent hydrolase (beta-lactamase superfamily II)